jgi:hypothetical protein
MTELEEALKDWAENERDIRMCEAAIAGGWDENAFPTAKLVLRDCMLMRPKIRKDIKQLGGKVPVTELQSREAEIERLKTEIRWLTGGKHA